MLLIDHQELTTTRGPRGDGAGAATSSYKFGSMEGSGIYGRHPTNAPADLIHALGDSAGLMPQHGLALRRYLRWSSLRERQGRGHGLTENSQKRIVGLAKCCVVERTRAV